MCGCNIDMSKFQSALPCRERRQVAVVLRGKMGFNPRSRVGSDEVQTETLICQECFNPRSRVGSDQLHGVQMTRRECFNPRSRVGSDVRMPNPQPPRKFQSALPCRERHIGREPGDLLTLFQSALPCRERPAGRARSGAPGVSIRAPV